MAERLLERTTLTRFAPIPEDDRQYPLEYMDANSVIKLREDDASVVIGICDPSDTAILAFLEDFHGKPVQFLLIERSELSAYLGKRLSTLDAESPKAAPRSSMRTRGPPSQMTGGSLRSSRAMMGRRVGMSPPRPPP